MSSDLLLLGQKLAIGATALVGFGYLFHLISGGPKSYTLRKWLQEGMHDIALVPAVLLFTAAFVIGIIVDDLSSSYASARAWLFANSDVERFEEHVSDCLMRPFFESEAELRFDVLLKEHAERHHKTYSIKGFKKRFVETEDITLQPLGKELLAALRGRKDKEHNALPQNSPGSATTDPSIEIYISDLDFAVPNLRNPKYPPGTDKASIFDSRVPRPIRCRIPDLNSRYYKAIDAANGLFYNAKNLVFTQSDYFNELSAIQERATFVRSFGVICSILFLFYLLASFGCSLLPGWNVRAYRWVTFVARYVVFLFACWLYFRVGEWHLIYALRVFFVIGVSAMSIYELFCIFFQKKHLVQPTFKAGHYSFFLAPISKATASDSDCASRQTVDRLVLFAIVTLFATYLSFRAARSEELGYDNRVFGYYISMLNNSSAETKDDIPAAKGHGRAH